MPDPDIRDLLSRMADELDHCRQLLSDDRREVHTLAAEARAALAAEPVEEGPTDDELLEAAAKALGYKSIPSDETCLTAEAAELLTFARAILARWCHPTAPPAPETGEQHVSQPCKLPEPGDDPSA